MAAAIALSALCACSGEPAMPQIKKLNSSAAEGPEDSMGADLIPLSMPDPQPPKLHIGSSEILPIYWNWTNSLGVESRSSEPDEKSISLLSRSIDGGPVLVSVNTIQTPSSVIVIHHSKITPQGIPEGNGSWDHLKRSDMTLSKHGTSFQVSPGSDDKLLIVVLEYPILKSVAERSKSGSAINRASYALKIRR